MSFHLVVVVVLVVFASVSTLAQVPTVTICSSLNRSGVCPRSGDYCDNGVCRSFSAGGTGCSTKNVFGSCSDPNNKCVCKYDIFKNPQSCACITRFCSVANPTGDCSSSEDVCKNTQCVSKACSKQNTDGDCPTGYYPCNSAGVCVKKPPCPVTLPKYFERGTCETTLDADTKCTLKLSQPSYASSSYDNAIGCYDNKIQYPYVFTTNGVPDCGLSGVPGGIISDHCSTTVNTPHIASGSSCTLKVSSDYEFVSGTLTMTCKDSKLSTPYPVTKYVGTQSSKCFSSDSIVKVLHSTDSKEQQSCASLWSSGKAQAKPTRLSSLSVGDCVQSMGITGELSFEKVLHLSHSQHSQEIAPMKSVEWQDETGACSPGSSRNQKLVLSEDHLVFTSTVPSKQLTHRPSFTSLQPARLLTADDWILIADEVQGTSWRRVCHVSNVIVTGLQNAWTKSGRIVISSVLVTPLRESTFATVQTARTVVTTVAWPLGLSSRQIEDIAMACYIGYGEVERALGQMPLVNWITIVAVIAMMLAWNRRSHSTEV